MHTAICLCDPTWECNGLIWRLSNTGHAPQQVLLDAGAKMVGKAQLNQLVCVSYTGAAWKSALALSSVLSSQCNQCAALLTVTYVNTYCSATCLRLQLV